MQISERLMNVMLENSYKDFHVKGFDYVCVSRNPGVYTVKLYFFDGDVSALPEVVAPHDHRYDFATRVIAGGVHNTLFQKTGERKDSKLYNSFQYRTPLLPEDGEGFKWEGEQWLLDFHQMNFTMGLRDTYKLASNQIHTIKILKPETILALSQGPSLPVDFTHTYFQGQAPQGFDGLYRKFTADELIMRMEQLEKVNSEASEAFIKCMEAEEQIHQRYGVENASHQ